MHFALFPNLQLPHHGHNSTLAHADCRKNTNGDGCSNTSLTPSPPPSILPIYHSTYDVHLPPSPPLHRPHLPPLAPRPLHPPWPRDPHFLYPALIPHKPRPPPLRDLPPAPPRVPHQRLPHRDLLHRHYPPLQTRLDYWLRVWLRRKCPGRDTA